MVTVLLLVVNTMGTETRLLMRGAEAAAEAEPQSVVATTMVGTMLETRTPSLAPKSMSLSSTDALAKRILETPSQDSEPSKTLCWSIPMPSSITATPCRLLLPSRRWTGKLSSTGKNFWLNYQVEKILNDIIYVYVVGRIDLNWNMTVVPGGKKKKAGPGGEDVCFNCQRKGHW